MLYVPIFAQGTIPPPIVNTQTAPTKPPSSQFTIIPIGINIGKRNVLQSSSVRGYEDGEKAVNFTDWLVPFADITKALNLKVTNLPDGRIELIGVGLIKRIESKDLITDPELGLAISIAKIENLLEVKTSFDIAAYAIVLDPPWLNFSSNNNRIQEPSVILEGLPVVSAPNFTLSAIGQQIILNGNQNSQLASQGNFVAIGSILGGSWLARVNQVDLSKTNTWQLQEGQYLKQSDFSDYVIGSQPTFWQNQSVGDFWGLTTVQRFGFKANDLNGAGFTPSTRLDSISINRTIEGTAPSGTLVQLVSGYDNTILAQALIDSSGIYRFENVPFSYNGGNYQVLLYSNGQLASTPTRQDATFINLPGQLTSGTSSLIVSAGLGRQTTPNTFLGSFTDVRGGIAYRQGISDSLTLGVGLVYDRGLLGLADIFYQPNNLPVKLALSASQIANKFKYSANFEFKPSSQINFNIFSNELFQSYNFNWNLLQGLSIFSSGNNFSNIANVGFALNQNIGDFTTFSNLKIDSRRELDWSSNIRWHDWTLLARANSLNKSVELNYDGQIFDFDGDQNLILSYETVNTNTLSTSVVSNSLTNSLLTFRAKYRSPYRLSDQRASWDLDLGYGISAQGSGFLASISTTIIPSLSLRLRYDGISATSNTSSYRIELSSSTNVSPYLRPSDTRFERLRSEGGVIIQPFLDKNNNGILDNNEEIYTKDLDLLLLINNKKFNPIFSDVTAQGIFLKLTPNVYRVDLDPSGYPLDWQPKQSSLAIEVVAGGYTTVAVPFIASYTVAGILRDAQGNPIAGAKLEAISATTGNQIISITNSTGVFYLEQLQLDNYNLKVNGKIPQPANLQITPDTNTFSETNLKLP